MTFDLHHVQLLIPPGGEDVARGFYAGVLGMTELTKPPVLAARGGCWFRSGGWEIHLAPVPGFEPATRAHPGVLVSDLDGLAKKLESSGRTVDWDGNFPGYRRFHSADDHGNRLEFLQAETAADGNRAQTLQAETAADGNRAQTLQAETAADGNRVQNTAPETAADGPSAD